MASNFLLEGPSRMPYYTDLVYLCGAHGGGAFGGRQDEFDWLITDLDCNYFPPELDGRAPLVLSGAHLTELVETWEPRVQFIWAVLSAFPAGKAPDPNSLDSVPFADGNPGFWHGSPRPQHPDAVAEVVCWDSTSLLLISRDDDLAERFRSFFAEAVDLDEYNALVANGQAPRRPATDERPLPPWVSGPIRSSARAI